MPGGKKHGPSIKNPKAYEAMVAKGMSKGMAAAISNSQVQGKGKGKTSKGGKKGK